MHACSVAQGLKNSVIDWLCLPCSWQEGEVMMYLHSHLNCLASFIAPLGKALAPPGLLTSTLGAVGQCLKGHFQLQMIALV